MTNRPNKGRQAGFTLVELVVTMTVSVVVVAFMAMFISVPVQGFTDQARRAKLVDAADTSLRRMGRDVRRALPNSIRTTVNGGVVALELLSTVDGARYRSTPPGGPPQQLNFTAPDNSFNVIGPLTQIAKPFNSVTHHLAVYNVGVPGADAYELANVITPVGTQIDIAADPFAGEDRVTLAPAFQFAFESPTQRIFLIDGPISYLCDPVAQTLTRYAGYTIAANHSSRDSAGELVGAGATGSVMADRVAGCAISYAPGSAERAGLVSIEINVAEQGETISLLSQVHVDNVP
jgi:MSHA biogenesis protein MshO